MNARAAEPASGAPDTPQVRLRLLGPQWMAMAEEAFGGVAQSPERYVAAGHWVAAWLDRLRALPPGLAAHPGPGSQDDAEERDAAAAAALLEAWDRRDSAGSGAPVPLTAGERAALTAAAFAIRYAEVADWLAARRRRRAMAAARSAADAPATGPRWLVLDEAGDPSGDPFITYRRLEVDPETGSGVLVETRPDDRFTGVIHLVRTALVDPNTGELIIDDNSKSWEFYSAEERESLIGRLRDGEVRDGREDAP